MNRRLVLLLTLSIAAVVSAFVWGVLVGKDKIFPYRSLRSAREIVFPKPPTRQGDLVETNLIRFETTFVNDSNALGLVGDGGALARMGCRILGVDSDGHFFVYEEARVVTMLDVFLDTNEAMLSAYLAEHVSSAAERKEVLDMFRVLDIAVKEEGGRSQIFVTHNYWHRDTGGKTTRLSRATVERMADLLDGRRDVVIGPWETIYETQPPLIFDPEVPSTRSPFASYRSGGRIVFDLEGNIVVGFGDHELDGVRYPEVASQNVQSSYGKLIGIDLQTLESRLIGTGLRNPQGLLRDRDGNILATDHGAQGGDEINLVRAGANFGWPFVTYGTDYNHDEWPLSSVQGSHEDYTLPLFAWVPSIGISNLIQIEGTPQRWAGDLLVSSLSSRSLYRVRMREDRVIFSERVRIGERIRDLEQLGDGTIVLWLDDARFLELTRSDRH